MSAADSAGPTDALVVGGGLAGLACAHGLARLGRSVRVVEAADAPGGRARTDWRRGRPVDRGFQALFRAYPDTFRLVHEVGLSRRDLRRFARAVMVHDGERWLRLARGPGALLPQGVPRADLVRLARLVAEVIAVAPDVLLDRDGPEPTTEAFLRARGFSERALEVLFRPLFGAITLDRSLAVDPGYFRFLLAMLARGPAVLPSDGLGMLADWTAAAVRQRGGAVETGARVDELEPDGGERVVGARLADGRRATARYVVLAVDPPAARRFLRPVDGASASRIPDQGASVTTAAYVLSRPLYRGRVVLLNGAPAGAGPRVDLVCQTTNVTRPKAPAGPHVLLAASITTAAPVDAGAVPDAVAETIGRWAPRFPWHETAELVEVLEHPFAQFRPLAGVRRDLPGPRTAAHNLILAGDLTRHPSIEGAVGSGAQAARIVDALLAA